MCTIKVKCVFDELLTFSIFWKLFVYASISVENIKKAGLLPRFHHSLEHFFGAPIFMLRHILKDAAFSRLATFCFSVYRFPATVSICVSGEDHLKSREHIAKVALEARCLCLWQ